MNDFSGKVQYICVDDEGAAWPRIAPVSLLRAPSSHGSRKEDGMNQTTLSALLWIAAGALLVFYLLRRRRRKGIGK